MAQKETPPSPPTEEQEARFERARAHAKLVRRQRERLQDELARLDEELASSVQIELQSDEQSVGSEDQVVFTPGAQAQKDLEATESYNRFVQSLCDSREEKPADEGYASRTPARQARVSNPAALRFEPYQPSPQPMTPQDQQRLMDFEEYRMFCQVRETQALMTPSMPYTVASGPSTRRPSRRPIHEGWSCAEAFHGT